MPRLDIADVFAADGPLAAAWPGYRPRDSQIELAQAIGQAIDQHATLVAEAGTGIGKTWAYLVPAILSGAKVMISTGTRTLQDQLFGRDLPRVRAALKVPLTIALLKGRSNYLCHYHFERMRNDERALKSSTEISQWRAITQFAKVTRSGDRGELGAIAEDADIWQRVTSNRENCLGQECPHIRDCFVVKARKQAQEAEVVVINHALFMADLVLREEGITDLLPQADVIVFDEAHQLPETATRFLGSSLSSHQVLDYGRMVEVAGLAHAREAMNWSEAHQRLETATREFRLTAAPIEQLPGRKATFDNIPAPAAFDAALAALQQVVEATAQSLAGVAAKHPDLAEAARVGTDIAIRLARWALPARGSASSELSSDAGAAVYTRVFGELAAPTAELDLQPQTVPQAGRVVGGSDGGSDADGDDMALQIAALCADAARRAPSAQSREGTGPSIRWIEHGMHHIRLHAAPLSVARVFSRFRRPEQAWIFTSATLSAAGDFRHFNDQLGLGQASVGQWASPFDYGRHGLLFVPQDMPEPAAPHFLTCFADRLMPLLAANPGGALVLCTTLRAVDRMAELLRERFDAAAYNWPLLRQGDATRRMLLERFQTLSHPVLVGSASFWEGIDLPGAALTFVAIDKLPFAPPDDPVIEARLRACREQGGNPFAQYQLPEAAIALKQGAGRLIRTETDWGVLMVADARLVDKPYGKHLWRGLPPFARTRDAAQAVNFFARRQASIEVVPGTT